MRVVTKVFAVSLLSLGCAQVACTSDDSGGPAGNNAHIDITPPAKAGTGGGASVGAGGGAGSAGKGTGTGGGGAGGAQAGMSGGSGQGGQAAGAGGSLAGAGGASGGPGVGGSGGDAGAGGDTTGGSGGGVGGASGSSGQGGDQAGGAGGDAGGTDSGGQGGSDQGGGGQGGSGGVVIGPNDIVVSTLNVALAGLGVPYESDRRQAIFDQVANIDADVVCVEEIWQDADKTALMAAATTAGKLTNFVHFATDDATPVDDPTDLDGNTPAPPGIACGASAQAALDKALTCIETKCDTMPGSDQGHVTNLDCPKSQCTAAAAGVLGTPKCYGCLAPQLASEKLADIKNTCETSTNPGLGFAGQNGVMILSKHALTNQEMYVLPSTWIRRIVAKATMAGPNGPIDVYCNHLSAIFTGAFYPYTGPYGASGPSATSPPNGWENEIFLQGKKLVSWVNAKSPGAAIIAGDFNAGPVVTDSMSNTSTAPTCVDTYNELNAAFPEALAPGYTPVCTFCSENVNVPAADKPTYTPQWLDHVFLKGFSPSATKLTERTFLDPIVATTDSMGMPLMTQISDHYGMRVIVTQP